MDKQEVLTLIKRNHKFGGIEYILGIITGIGYVESGYSKKSVKMIIDEGYVYKDEFTPDEYDKFINIIEELYPGLCKFDYKLKKESE